MAAKRKSEAAVRKGVQKGEGRVRGEERKRGGSRQQEPTVQVQCSEVRRVWSECRQEVCRNPEEKSERVSKKEIQAEQE